MLNKRPIIIKSISLLNIIKAFSKHFYRNCNSFIIFLKSSSYYS